MGTNANVNRERRAKAKALHTFLRNTLDMEGASEIVSSDLKTVENTQISF